MSTAREIAILGGGMVGGAMARDLLADGDRRVTVADLNGKALERLEAVVGDDPDVRGGLVTLEMDLAVKENVRRAVKDADVVIGAVPGFMGYRTLETVLEEGKLCCDISFMPEDARGLDRVARKNGGGAVVDCGVAPGLSNMMIGHLEAGFRDAGMRMVRASIMVGGLPRTRRWPYEYKAPFSPVDVLEEYTRPARMKRDGRIVTLPALSEVEPVEVPGIGTLEAFNTDGLRSLLWTVDCPDLSEKTLRYPGHAEKMRMLRETGFFSTTPLDIGGCRVTPREVTARLLFPLWRLDEGEEEFTVLRVEAEGEPVGEGQGEGKERRREKHVYHLLDRTDTVKGMTSMARTTGFPCTITARLMLEGKIRPEGVVFPEELGRDPAVFRRILEGLEARGVIIQHHAEGYHTDG
ncbi:MAG: saccharopine dehydrogenase NADP-binding domain-containing protein [Thermoplasmata archaeon]|nr:saccharopine dehydrogenase NADP-binding domain-containing protein [Thermoplasmata archaeon]